MKKTLAKVLAIFMAIFPWITYFHLTEYSEAEQAIYGGMEGMNLDFFVYSKEIILIVMAVLMVLCFFLEKYLYGKKATSPLGKEKDKWLYILMAVFTVGTLISTVFAEYKANALWGSKEIGEGLLTLLAYLVLILMYYHFFADEDSLVWIKRAMIAIAGVTGVFSIVEWFYKPLLEIEFVKRLVAPAVYQGMLTTLKADRFTDAISLTFYNPGYYGGFVCLIIPFLLMLCLQAKCRKAKIGYGVLFIGLLFGVIASGSTTALYVSILEIVLGIAASIFVSKDKKKSGIQSVVVVLVTAVSLITFGQVTGNYVVNLAINDNSFAGEFWFWNFDIKDIRLQGNSVQIVGAQNTLDIYYENGRFGFRNEWGEELSAIRTEDGVTFEEEGYESIRVSAVDVSNQVKGATRCVRVDAGYLDPIEFFLLEDGTFSGIGQGGAIIKDLSDGGAPEFFEPYYGMLTGRGYIWSNTLPILKDTLLIGKGPGNFAFNFKNYDYVNMLSIYKTIQKVITKPHSAYLQYATEVGVPAAIAFFGIFVGAILKSIKLIWKKKIQIEMTEKRTIHISATISIIGFLICSIINDSMVTVTPVACMIVGVLLAYCCIEESKKISKKQKK